MLLVYDIVVFYSSQFIVLSSTLNERNHEPRNCVKLNSHYDKLRALRYSIFRQQLAALLGLSTQLILVDELNFLNCFSPSHNLYQRP